MALTVALQSRVIVFTDSQVACAAITRGSRVHAMQEISRRIFIWCLNNAIFLMPCWAPRESGIIRGADARSRWNDKYGQRTPESVFIEANTLAWRLWDAYISFDRMASHLNAMPPASWGVKQLPFNSLWNQPGSSGVDMFVQPPESWQSHINFIHPAAPTVGRVLSFLPATGARAIVVIPTRLVTGVAWWSNMTRIGGPGVVSTRQLDGFLIFAINHRRLR